MPETSENLSPGGNQPDAELAPALYAELRRLAAALITQLQPRQVTSFRTYA